jgi:hypothetical protein
MPREIGGQSSAPKEAIPDESCDPQVEIMGDVKGKVEQVKLLDLDLMDQVLFLQMNISVFWDLAPDAMGGMQFVSKPEFINLFNSTIMNLRDLPVFGTTGEVAWCTKFLISRVHDKSLWLDRRYLIHVRISTSSPDYPSRVRMSQKDSKAQESMGRRRVKSACMRNSIHREVDVQPKSTQSYQRWSGQPAM